MLGRYIEKFEIRCVENELLKLTFGMRESRPSLGHSYWL